MKLKKLKNKQGFTLIEVIIVAAIVGVFLIKLPENLSNMFNHKFEMLQSQRAELIAEQKILEQYYRISQNIRINRLVRKETIKMFEQNWRVEYKTNKTLVKGIYKHTISIFDEQEQLQSEMSVFLKGI